eukprot:15456737-Alexandrium_andersonii.AAC.1
MELSGALRSSPELSGTLWYPPEPSRAPLGNAAVITNWLWLEGGCSTARERGNADAGPGSGREAEPEWGAAPRRQKQSTNTPQANP